MVFGPNGIFVANALGVSKWYAKTSPSFILLCYRQNAGFVHKSVDVGTKYVHENVANKVKFVHKSVDASCGVR